MRFISAIYVFAALVLATGAAPVAHAPHNGDVISEDRDTSLAGRTGTDVFDEVDLTARVLAITNEDPGDRGPGNSGCIVA
ncbi:hypothetical protein C8R43DRAFT_1134707 [Mycena crocata]|nr:hypothetical protein C8R43DRAFT_1134707 [Mycena crocata]